MSIDPLPQKLEQGVEHFAKLRHISHDEAVLLADKLSIRKMFQNS